MKVTHVASATVVVLTSAAILSGAGALIALSTSTAAAVGLGVLSVGFLGASLGSISAWINTKDNQDGSPSTNCKKYFNTAKDHTSVGIAALFQFTAQSLFRSVLDGIGLCISDRMLTKMRGV